MDYRLDIASAPDSIPGGTAVLLTHPSTGGTDEIDTGFLAVDGDRFLVVSTRSTAREVHQKLSHYDVDASRADVLDAVSVDRGYSRRNAEHVHYVNAPDDVDGIVSVVAAFLEEDGGRRRLSVDSVSELAYYAGDATAVSAVRRIVDRLEEHDAVGLFHVSPEVHDPDTMDRLRAVTHGTLAVDDDGSIDARF
ncbi:MAG: hypothetical protein ABEJ77_00220 [Halanaeroarchaeum sp.]